MSRLILILLIGLAPLAHAQTRYVWTGGTGDWSDAARWTPAGVPAAADTAVIGNGIATLDQDVTVAGLELRTTGSQHGTVAGTSDLTVTARMFWGAGRVGVLALGGSGTVTVGPEATLVIDVSSQIGVAAGRTFVNQGTAVWQAGAWYGPGRFRNEGTLTLALDEPPASFCFTSTPSAFTNAAGGEMRVTTVAPITLNCIFDNAGLVRVESGTLTLRGWSNQAGSESGQYVVVPGATLAFAGSNNRAINAANGSSLTGGGTVVVDGGNTTISPGTTLEISRLILRGATFPSNARFRINGEATIPVIELGVARIGGRGTVTVSDTLRLSAPGTALMEENGTTVVAPGAALVLGSSALQLTGGRTFSIAGDWTWPAGFTLTASDTSSVRNLGTATLAGTGARVANGRFDNEGTLRHEDGDTRMTLLSNLGTVDVLAGTLKLETFGNLELTDTGRYRVDEGARLEFVRGNRTLDTSSEVAGTGTVQIGVGLRPPRGTWRPGASAGVLTVEGNFPKPAPEGVVEIELGGPEAGTQFDQLAVTGQVRLGGTLRVLLTDGFVPAVGDRFLIMPAGSVNATDNAFAALDLPDGLAGYTETVAGGVDFVVGQPVSSEPGAEVPLAFAVDAPFPNPVRSAATLRVALPLAGPLRVEAFDVLGRRVAVLAEGEAPAGVHALSLDASGWSSGAYVVRVTAGGETAVRRLVVAR